MTPNHPVSFRQNKIPVFTEWAILLGILTICNLHLFWSGADFPPVYFSGGPEKNSLFQMVFHPFVHVSRYHLALDAGAFILLYAGFNGVHPFKKLLYIFFSGLTGLTFTEMLAPDIARNGFCGLSGIAHGLTAVYGIETVMTGRSAKQPLFILGLVTAKSLAETAMGQGVFIGLHLGRCGEPIPASHLGGIIGGLFCFFCLFEKKDHPAAQGPRPCARN